MDAVLGRRARVVVRKATGYFETVVPNVVKELQESATGGTVQEVFVLRDCHSQSLRDLQLWINATYSVNQKGTPEVFSLF